MMNRVQPQSILEGIDINKPSRFNERQDTHYTVQGKVMFEMSSTS
jgi:hypothetical protein